MVCTHTVADKIVMFSFYYKTNKKTIKNLLGVALLKCKMFSNKFSMSETLTNYYILVIFENPDPLILAQHIWSLQQRVYDLPTQAVPTGSCWFDTVSVKCYTTA